MITRLAVPIVLMAVALGGSRSLGQSPPKYQGNCSDAGCHDQYTKRAVIHAPVDADSCDDCHELKDAGKHQFAFVEEGGALCGECHDEFEGKVKHSPAEEGECTTCHDPHASEAASLLLAKTVAEVCADCHDDVAEDLKFLHGPVAAGGCTTCHDPHASDHQAMLSSAEREICLKCHANFRTRIESVKHTHAPVTDGCLECHRAHGADNKMMLAATGATLCVDCHDEIGELMGDAKVRHDALNRIKACAACHDPHGSDFEHVLLAEPMTLCLSCHDRPLPSEDGKIADIAKVLRDNPSHHGPVADKDCAACHASHGGAYYRLLREAYPSRFYAPYTDNAYALCFGCHDDELVLEEETDEATAFRNGERNLHYVHVNRKVKGRSCGACHDAHASSRPNLIAHSVSFGAWQLPIGFQKTPAGGSCQSGCHKVYRYDRENPVDNLP